MLDNKNSVIQMKKIVLAVIFIFCVSVSSVSAKNFYNQNSELNQVYRLEKDVVINQDLFAAAERVEIEGTVNGDLYVAGKNIIIDGRVTGDLLAAGASINLAGDIGADARLAGGNIIISGKIGKNASLAGGNITLSDSSVIYGGLSTLFGNLSESASIGRYLKGAGGNINISNHIGGNVDLAIGSLNISGNSRILGNLAYWSKDRATIDRDARIAGRTIFNKTENYPSITGYKVKKTANNAFRFGSLIFTYILGLIFLYLFPQFSHKTVKNIREKTFPSFLIGLLGPFLIFIVCLILIVTLVGIPLSILIFLIYISLLYFSRIPVIFTGGSILTQKIGTKENIFWSFTFGLLLYFILTSIPVINVVIKFLTLTIGSGAFILALKTGQKKAVSLGKRSLKK